VYCYYRCYCYYYYYYHSHYYYHYHYHYHTELLLLSCYLLQVGKSSVESGTAQGSLMIGTLEQYIITRGHNQPDRQNTPSGQCLNCDQKIKGGLGKLFTPTTCQHLTYR